VSELAALISENQPCVVLTGAGVSTESGVAAEATTDLP
jgi:NAD-dependent SIR2 family protein deacetylase